MTDEISPAPSAPLFREIKSAQQERTYRFRSLSFVTYLTVSVMALYVLGRLLEVAALAGGASLRGLLVTTIALTFVTLVVGYVVGSFWIYNAACNIRALGARGVQISPGWAVGWFAVPLASLVMPFQGVEEIYQASGSPLAWRQLKTPALLRWWWGMWLVSNVGSSVTSIITRGAATDSDLALARQLTTGEALLSGLCAALFSVIIWRVYRRQHHSRAHVSQVAQVFA